MSTGNWAWSSTKAVCSPDYWAQQTAHSSSTLQAEARGSLEFELAWATLFKKHIKKHTRTEQGTDLLIPLSLGMSFQIPPYNMVFLKVNEMLLVKLLKQDLVLYSHCCPSCSAAWVCLKVDPPALAPAVLSRGTSLCFQVRCRYWWRMGKYVASPQSDLPASFPWWEAGCHLSRDSQSLYSLLMIPLNSLSSFHFHPTRDQAFLANSDACGRASTLFYSVPNLTPVHRICSPVFNWMALLIFIFWYGVYENQVGLGTSALCTVPSVLRVYHILHTWPSLTHYLPVWFFSTACHCWTHSVFISFVCCFPAFQSLSTGKLRTFYVFSSLHSHSGTVPAMPLLPSRYPLSDWFWLLLKRPCYTVMCVPGGPWCGATLPSSRVPSHLL